MPTQGRIYTFLLCAFFMFASLSAQNNDVYIVQVAAYGEKVPLKIFTERGLSNVKEQFSLNTFYRYYIDGFESLDEAEMAMVETVEQGFPFARVVNLSEMRDLCAASCGEEEAQASVVVYSEDQIIRVRNIFFGFDSSYLNKEGRDELNKLSAILLDNKSYLVEVHAHTDSRGSFEYNLALSERRMNSVINFLKFKEVPGFQIEPFHHGEAAPIARNDNAGMDSPAGRQFNRRVELKVKDQYKLIDLVEEIAVPVNLKSDDN